MPKLAHYTLAWSPLHQAYELYKSQGNEALTIVSASPVWLLGVGQTCSFAFHGQYGSYTARKERKQRGEEGYWYAYARVGGKLIKRYLGKSINLTLARLEQAAQELWLDPQNVLLQKAGRAASRLLPSPPPSGRENASFLEKLSEAYAFSSDDAQQRLFRSDQLGGTDHYYGVGGRKTEAERAKVAVLSRSSDVLVPLANYIATPPVSVYAHDHLAKRQGSSPGDHEARPTIARLPTDPLLATKLYVPRPCPHLVHRSRLIQRLWEGMEQALILLSAPAGFGKSTLLADWLASRAIPAAWLSLEPQDNDPARFLSYLLAALQNCDPRLGLSGQALLHSLQPAALESVLTVLINGLQARMTGNQEHVVLVLDNYQVITNGSLHHALSFLLEHLPSGLHLVLASREDPPLPLARLRGQGDLLELRASDLRFTHEETATFLTAVMGLPLSTEQSALLQAHTEGWITGLQLAAFSLQGCDDPAGFIVAFSGSNRYVVDYLLDEVLSHQSAAVQDFLVQTSLLDRLSAPLCDAVRAQGGSQALLDLLEHANLFLVPLDDERVWYRYHQLFAEALRQWLRQTALALVPDLHLRASRWYEQHGFCTEAVSHALAAAAFEEAARLIEQCLGTFVLGNQMQTLCGWLHAFPEALVLARPSLRLLYALALMYTNHWEEASVYLQAIERWLNPGADMPRAHERLLQGQVTACRSLLARLSGDLEGCVALSQRALELLPETDTSPLTHLLRAGALVGAAHAYLVSGDVSLASERLPVELVAYARASAYRLLSLRGLILLARLQVLQGRLTQAGATYEEVAQVLLGHNPETISEMGGVPPENLPFFYTRKHGDTTDTNATNATNDTSATNLMGNTLGPEELQVLIDSPAYYFGLGDLLREWNELEAAHQHLARGMELLEDMLSIDAEQLWLGYAALARLQHAQGSAEQALAILDAFLQLAHQRHIAPLLLAQAAALRAQLELARGDLPAARHWAASCGLSPAGVPCYLREPAYLTLARVRLAEELLSPTRHGLADVLLLLERLLAEAEASRRWHSVLEILLVLALAREEQGDHRAALAALGRALVLAEPEGYIRLFLDEGPALLALLRRAQRHGLAPRYVARLLQAAGAQAGPALHFQALPAPALVEPLTERERDVLRLVLLDGASNREIAHQLVLSVNTVKKHIANLYGKLHVQSRAQAIAKARLLQLL